MMIFKKYKEGKISIFNFHKNKHNRKQETAKEDILNLFWNNRG